MSPLYSQNESFSKNLEQANLEMLSNEEAYMYKERGYLGLTLLRAERCGVYRDFFDEGDEKKFKAAKHLIYLLQAFNSLAQSPHINFSKFLSACESKSLKAVDVFFKGECVVVLDDFAAYPFKKISFFNSNFQKRLTLKEKIEFFGKNAKPIVSPRFPYTVLPFTHTRAKMELNFQELSKKNKINLHTKNRMETTLLSVLNRVSFLRGKDQKDLSEAYQMWLNNKQIEETEEEPKVQNPLLMCFSFLPPNNDYSQKIEAFVFYDANNLQEHEGFADKITSSLYCIFEKMDSLKNRFQKNHFQIGKIKISLLDVLCPAEVLMYEGAFENGCLDDNLWFLTPEQMGDSTINKIHLILLEREKRSEDGEEERLNQTTIQQIKQEEQQLIKNLKQQIFDKKSGLLAKTSKKFVQLTLLETPEIARFSFSFEKKVDKMFKSLEEDMKELVATFYFQHVSEMLQNQPTPVRFLKHQHSGSVQKKLVVIEEAKLPTIEESIEEEPAEEQYVAKQLLLPQPSLITKSKKKRMRKQKAIVQKTKAL